MLILTDALDREQVQVVTVAVVVAVHPDVDATLSLDSA